MKLYKNKNKCKNGAEITIPFICRQFKGNQNSNWFKY